MSGNKRREIKKAEEHHSNHSINHPASQTSHSHKKGLWQKLVDVYTNKWKALMLIPFIILLLSFGVLGYSYITKGEFIGKGVSIKGGTSITILSTTLNSDDMKKTIETEFPKASIEARTLSSGGGQIGVIVEASDVDSDTLQQFLQAKYSLNKGDYTVEVTGSSLGASFYSQMILAIIAAFILMGLVVYFYFRTLAPSAAIILAAFSDMITTLAVINLMGIKLTAAGIAAFLMLIGYSVDTDILLTARVLKRKEGTVDEKVFSAIKTGTTMTFAAIAATGISLILAQSDVIKQIMLILVLGLIADLIYTWIQNVGLLKWYLEKKEKKGVSK